MGWKLGTNHLKLKRSAPGWVMEATSTWVNGILKILSRAWTQSLRRQRHRLSEEKKTDGQQKFDDFHFLDYYSFKFARRKESSIYAAMLKKC